MIDRRSLMAGTVASLIWPAEQTMTARDHIEAIAAKFGGREAMGVWEYRFLEVVVMQRLENGQNRPLSS